MGVFGDGQAEGHGGAQEEQGGGHPGGASAQSPRHPRHGQRGQGGQQRVRPGAQARDQGQGGHADLHHEIHAGGQSVAQVQVEDGRKFLGHRQRRHQVTGGPDLPAEAHAVFVVRHIVVAEHDQPQQPVQHGESEHQQEADQPDLAGVQAVEACAGCPTRRGQRLPGGQAKQQEARPEQQDAAQPEIELARRAVGEAVVERDLESVLEPIEREEEGDQRQSERGLAGLPPSERRGG